MPKPHSSELPILYEESVSGNPPRTARATAQGLTTLEGTWRAISGTGKFKGMKAQGTYKGRMTSPSEVEMSWEGHYELAASKAA